MTRDEIYRAHNDPAAPFEFSEQVVKVFPDMIERSVPGYRLLLELTPILVRRAVSPKPASTTWDVRWARPRWPPAAPCRNRASL